MWPEQTSASRGGFPGPDAGASGNASGSGAGGDQRGRAMSTRQPNHNALDDGQLLRTLAAVRKGDFSARMPPDQTGVAGKVADTLNEIIELNETLVAELIRVGTVVGK